MSAKQKGSIKLKVVPDDVKSIILRECGILRAKKKTTVSQELTVYSIIRDWDKTRSQTQKPSWE